MRAVKALEPESVARGLGRAVRAARASTSAEAVHDVRVAVRRMLVALGVEVADDASPPAPGERALRRLMRACGGVRDRDVATELLRALAPHAPTLERLGRQRRKAERRLRTRLDRWVKRRRWKSLGRGADGGEPPRPVHAPGRASLAALVARGDAVFAAPLDEEALHALRLELKHTRYAFERAPGEGPAAKARLEALRDLQDALGQVTDVARTLELLRRKVPAKVARALEAERQRRYAAARDAWRREAPHLGVARTEAPRAARALRRAPGPRPG